MESAEGMTTLWLTAGSDRACLKSGRVNIVKSGDPLGQSLFMLLLLRPPSISFEVRTAAAEKPPAKLLQLGVSRCPVLECAKSGRVHWLEDEIISELLCSSSSSSYHDSFLAGPAHLLSSDLFRAFAYFIRDVAKTTLALDNALKRIDKYLGERATIFVEEDGLSPADCFLIPRLHSVRVSGKALKDYEVSSELVHLWEYMRCGYSERIFRESCPSDEVFFSLPDRYFM